MPNRVAIVGIGQTRHKSTRRDVTLPEMVNEAVRAALADAELTMKDIEAVFTSNMETFEGIYLPDHGAATEIGAYMKPGFKVCTGGTSGASVVVEGFCMVASGLYDVVMVLGFEKQDCGETTAAITAAATPIWGKGAVTGAIGEFAKQALSYMETSGADLGMHSFDQYLYKLHEAKLVSLDSALNNATNRADLERRILIETGGRTA